MDFDRLPELGHVLSVDQFDRPFLDKICDVTQEIRELRDKPDGKRLLKEQFADRTAMLYFTQPSSRTYTSFAVACQELGVSIVDVRDPHTSSEVKEESLLDSIRTFSSYVDVLIMRSPVEGLARDAAAYLDATPRPRPIVNAGNAKDEHPTQALLDIYTMRRSFKDRGGVDGKTVAFVGDLARSRVVRSLAKLMYHYYDMQLLLVSPPEFRMKPDILAHLDQHRVRYEETADFNGAVRQADVVYMTRVQDEHDAADGTRSPRSFPEFHFTQEHLGILRPEAIVMHPGPRRDELDPATDDDPRSKYWRQMRNGKHLREAVIACILATLQRKRNERRR
ncbi:aspartate carbamoyltransferase [Patescibacteria group bacterium]|nr:MAG: aspartate carbamoyltransferase [Patescibacteria group bacterium]